VTPTTLYAGTGGANCGGVYRSTDGGDSWGLARVGYGTIRGLVIDPITPTTLYAGTDSGVFKTTDGGTSSSLVNTGLTRAPGGLEPYVLSLVIDPAAPTTLYADNYHMGFYKSTDGASTWTKVDKGPYALAVD